MLRVPCGFIACLSETGKPVSPSCVQLACCDNSNGVWQLQSIEIYMCKCCCLRCSIVMSPDKVGFHEMCDDQLLETDMDSVLKVKLGRACDVPGDRCFPQHE